MSKLVRQAAETYRRWVRHRQRWQSRCFKWALWPHRLSGHLVLGQEVRLLVPVRCDGDGTVSIADRTTLGWPPAMRYGNGAILLQARDKDAWVKIGPDCAFSNNVSIVALKAVEIDDHCLIGDFVSIMDSDFHAIAPDQRRHGPPQTEPVHLERNVWLASRVIVQKGVTIGANSIVTPNAVVTSSLPPNCIAGGVPARVIRTLDASPPRRLEPGESR